jgi:hypothetical protein
MLGFEVAQSTVSKYMVQGGSPSQGWKTFLGNHAQAIAAIDLFVVPTLTFERYIPYVVSQARSWGRTTLRDGSTRFCRSSLQRGWITSEEGRVLEDVFVSDAKQTIYFLGRPRMVEESGNTLAASPFQPLFHVRHAVGGSEQAPLNLWSIVLLTDAPDPRYCEPFEQMMRAGLLPGFLEICIERGA